MAGVAVLRILMWTPSEGQTVRPDVPGKEDLIPLDPSSTRWAVLQEASPRLPQQTNDPVNLLDMFRIL